MTRFELLLVVGLSCTGGPAALAAAPEVVLVADLLDQLPAASVENSPSCGVRRPGTAGGVRRDALFEHPPAPGASARVTYSLNLPPVDRDDLLLLAFDVAIADGITPGAGVDGVRFGVEVDGRELFTTETDARSWQTSAVDLGAFAGRTVRLVLVTDARKTSSFDWALWGNPRVLHFRNSPAGTSLRTAVAAGAVALRSMASNAARGRLRGLDRGEAKTFLLPGRPAGANRGPWTVLDFSFPGAQGAELVFDDDAKEPKDIEVRWASFPAQPRIVLARSRRAISHPGDTVPLRFEVRNEGRGRLEGDTHQLRVAVGGQDYPDYPLPAVDPGESWQGDWTWVAPNRPGAWPLTAVLRRTPDNATVQQVNGVVRTVVPVEPQSIENHLLRLDFQVGKGERSDARLLGRNAAGDWAAVAVWAPLMRVVLDVAGGPVEWDVPFREVRRTLKRGQWSLARTFESNGIADPEGVPWKVSLTVDLDPARPVARVTCTWQPAADRRVLQLLGPNLLVGEETSGTAKAWGLFPGLEYLTGAEPSSNPRDFAPPLHDRRSPHPHKLTIPLMAVSVGRGNQEPVAQPGRFFAPDSLKDRAAWMGPAGFDDLTVSLLWDPFQKWDEVRTFPTPRFASPNIEQGMENHRLALFLPSVPEQVAENAEYATAPFVIAAGQSIRLHATLAVTAGPVMSAVRTWLDEHGGLPAPGFPPRGFQAELDVCREGLLKTVWDETSGKWRHCIDWPSSHAPGFAALLWIDAQLAQAEPERRRSRARVDQVAARMLAEGGGATFASSANCHLMEWEFPFLYGHLPEAFSAIDRDVAGLAASQQPEGGWTYQPGNAEQADLGAAGDSVLGTSARRAAKLLRYARITGDSAAWQAGAKALAFMERFLVPRGGQTWECPMYEPDLLAAAYAIGACVEAHRISGDLRWLQNAVYWAESGVPFVYLWTLPGKPMMLGATIPVFGSTFYSHSWLATPVQWCGLVYAYHLLHLADLLEQQTTELSGSPLPLVLHFKPADWRRIVDLITTSALHQQYAEGPRIGTYPDSITRFEDRNPAFLNPEDILVNVLAREGHDPDIRTVRLTIRNGVVTISSGARIENAREIGTNLEFRLRSFPGEPSHTLATVDKPQHVRVDAQPLQESAKPPGREPGWWWDPKHRRLYLTVPHPNETVEVVIQR